MARLQSYVAGFILAAQGAAAQLPEINQDVYHFSLPPDLFEQYNAAKTAYWGAVDGSTNVSDLALEANRDVLNTAADAFDNVVAEVFTRFADARDEISRTSPTAMAFYSSEHDGDQILSVVKDVREFLGIDFSIIAVDSDIYPDISQAYEHEGPTVRVVYGNGFYADFPVQDISVTNFMGFMEDAFADLAQEEPGLELFTR
ncbi:MAG: hypothetical protein AB8B83_09395 [Bdellovibrionales bacterium]